MSFNPNTGLVYIPASYTPFPYAATAELAPGATGYVRPTGTLRTIKDFIGPVAPEGVRGGLQAWDPVNQKLVWQSQGGGGIGGGTVTTGGNLVFQVQNDGTFKALSADKGEKLFEINVGRTGALTPPPRSSQGRRASVGTGGWPGPGRPRCRRAGGS